MMPRLGDQFNIDIKVISKPRHEFQTPSYMELSMPKAPAIMIGAKVIVASSDIEEEKLISAIKQQLK
jgi:hypothetical protein